MARNRPLTVLMTTDTVGGVWDYSLELVRHLSLFGIQTILASMGQLPSSAQIASAGKVDGLTLEPSTYKLEWMPGSDRDVVRAGKWLLSLEERFRPDIVHVNGYTHAALPWRSPCLAVAHSCVLSWWLFVKGDHAPREWMDYAEGVGKGLRSAALVVAPTRAFLTVLQSIYGTLPRTRVIHNGRDPNAYRPLAKSDYIFSAGRIWDDAKNIAALESVCPRLPWPVIVAGDCGSSLAENPPTNLKYAGFLQPEAMCTMLSKASIYALPARYEPFGLSILEAALSGCTLVLGDIPFLRELWEDIALFVPPGDQDQLEQTLQLLIENRSLRTKLGRAARERGRALTSSRMARHYVNCYLQLLDWADKIELPAARAYPSCSLV